MSDPGFVVEICSRARWSQPEFF